MANFCEVCGKGTMSGMNVSHSHVKTKKPGNRISSESALSSTAKLNELTSALVAFVPAKSSVMFNDYRKSVAYEGSAFLIQHTESAVFLHKASNHETSKNKKDWSSDRILFYFPRKGLSLVRV